MKAETFGWVKEETINLMQWCSFFAVNYWRMMEAAAGLCKTKMAG